MRVVGHFEVFGLLNRLLFKDLQILHSVYPESHDILVFITPADSIVEVVIPVESIRTHEVKLSVMPQNLILITVKLYYVEADLLLCLNCIIYSINYVIDVLIPRFDHTRGVYVSAELLSLVDACKTSDLALEISTFLLGNKPG